MKVYRCHRAGVYMGEQVGKDEERITIRGRHLWSWTGALDCATLADIGPSGGKISANTTVSVRRDDVVEVHEATEAAAVALEQVKPWSR